MDPNARALLLSLILFGGSLAGAGAENPRVSLKVEKATAAEAAAALSQASGIPVELFAPQMPAGAPPPREPELEERASFDWSGVTFARALRQLCARYQLVPSRTGIGYTLQRGFAGAPGPAARRVGLTERNGIRLFARRVSINSQRSLNFAGEGGEQNDHRLTVEIGCEFADGDAEAFAGVGNVTAKDDRGQLLVSEMGFGFTGRFPGGPFPDEWRGMVSLSGPHPRATKLVWLEGDLIGYKVHKTHRVEFPLPAAEAAPRRQVGDAVIELTRFEPPREGEGAPERFNAGPTLHARIFLPAGARFGPMSGFPMSVPVLVGASGRIYTPQGSSSGGGGGGPAGSVYETTARFQPFSEPVVKAVFQFVERSQPEKLFTFRMQEIPLPPEGAFVPRRVAPAAPGFEAAPAPTRPYHQEGGGILRNTIQIEGRPAPEGTLSLGLSLKTGEEWSAIRWLDVEVGADGVARLEDLKPGTYRLLRIYRPKAPVAALTGAGAWQNGEITFQAIAGKETAPLPLRWLPAPGAKKPASTDRIGSRRHPARAC